MDARTRITPLAGGDDAGSAPLTDPYGRAITYLRVSVTDRCDLRCTYCMPEQMSFRPKAEILSLEELMRLISAFIGLGVRKVRLTGGEPLVRRGVDQLIAHLGQERADGRIDEITLTTNATQLARHLPALRAAGVRRINVSLDTLDGPTFTRITRRPVLDTVLRGIDAALAEDMAVKINTVALRHDNAAEIPAMVEWAHSKGMDLTVIEVMPLGEIDQDRMDQYLPLTEVRTDLEKRWTLTPVAYRTGGPSRYVRIEETGGRLGFISPLTNNFCAGCNRVRLTCSGRLYMCLGQEDAADFRAVLRSGADDDVLDAAIVEAISRKPRGHDFEIRMRGAAPAVPRRMSDTGG